MQTTVTKKALLLILLLFLTCPAWSAWAIVNETKEFNLYVDPSTVRKDGALRKVWEIMDFKLSSSEGYMSILYKKEYDCKEERLRLLAISSHSESMAGGKTLFSRQLNEDWEVIPPRTSNETILSIVCAK